MAGLEEMEVSQKTEHDGPNRRCGEVVVDENLHEAEDLPDEHSQ